jgi:predicted enzyme related to lactoylglutathione lyase
MKMIQHPEITPSPTTEVPGPDLFTTVIRVANWVAMVAWYVEMLSLLPVVADSEHQFTLLAAGTGRLALQGGLESEDSKEAGRVRLVFQVPDVDQEWKRLISKGLEISPPLDNAREGYREIRLQDPEGTLITLFSWIDAAQERKYGKSPV